MSDESWTLIVPVMPNNTGLRGRPWNDHRRTLEGIIWRFHTGSPWRNLPAYSEAWQSVAERHLRWSKDGTYARLFKAVRGDTTDQGSENLQAMLLSVDSTIVRAHQHAAGASRGVHTRG